MCNSMDQLGRAREIAMKRFVYLHGEKLHREQEAKGFLEQKNRDLEKEIQRLRERDTFFIEE